MFKTATIDLELNKGNFLAGLEKIKKSFSDFGSNVQKSFNNNLGALGSLYLHTKALRNVFGDVKKVVDFSQLYSLNAEKVSEFRNQFALFGGTVDDVLKIQKKFQDGLKDFRVEGKGLFLDLAKQFKITPQKGNGQFLGFDEFVEKLREVYKSSNDVGKQKLLSNFDNDLGLLRLLQATDEEYEATAAQAKKMGVINERTAKTIREFINVFQTFTRLLKNMGVYVLDVLNPIVKGLNFCIMALMELGEGTKKFLAALLLIRPVLAILQLLAGSLKSLALTGKMLFNTFFGLGKMLISFGKIFVGVFKFNPLATFIASVTFLIWQLKKLKDNWQDVKDMFKNPIESIKTIGGEIKAKFNDVFGRDKKDGNKKNDAKTRGIEIPFTKQNNWIGQPMLPTQNERLSKIVNNNVHNTTNNNDYANKQNKQPDNRTFKFGDIVINGVNNPKQFASQLSNIIQQQVNGVR